MFNVNEINTLHQDKVVAWHQNPIENRFEGFLHTVCQQHSFNFQLWHEEDIARSPDVGDQRIAQVKRAIDKLNQQRNDWIEKLDDQILQAIDAKAVKIETDAPLNTETPGSAIDRLSIMSLRIFHMQEQLQRDDVDQQHIESVQAKLALCNDQQADLSRALGTLIEDIFAGRKRLKLYRQMKMYNDPKMNPALYQSTARKAG